MAYVRILKRVRKNGEVVRYAQLVRSYRVGKKVRQEVLCNLGRVDTIEDIKKLKNIALSILKMVNKLSGVEEENKQLSLFAKDSKEEGRAYLFKKLWERAGLDRFFKKLGKEKGINWDLNQAIYEMVLNRLTEPASKRRLFLEWRKEHKLEGKELKLHHYYRALDVLADSKERVEDELYNVGRNLFTREPKLIFFDTTSTYFEGNGPEGLAEYGYSKDKRSDRKQILISLALREEGFPVYHKVWSGNEVDVKLLKRTVEELKNRWGIKEVIWVTDRGCVSSEVLKVLVESGMKYIVGLKLRRTKVGKEVLSRAGRYQKVADNLYVKEVYVNGERYILCFNPERAEYERKQREEGIRYLQKQLERNGIGALKKGFKRFLKLNGEKVEIDWEKLREENRYDGKWIIKTNTDLLSEEVAKSYKELWRVEEAFRNLKDVLSLRPIYHWTEKRVRGHIAICVLAYFLQTYLAALLGNGDVDKGRKLAKELVTGVKELKAVRVNVEGDEFLLRTEVDANTERLLKRIKVVLPPRCEKL